MDKEIKDVSILQLSYGNYVSLDDYIDLQQRIDKAIEYIEKEYKENIIIADYCDNPITPQDLYNDILNILKGDDTNEKQ